MDCFVILGSVNLLVDTKGLDEYREIYCNTIQIIRELIIEGTLSEATGVESTAMYSDTPGVANIECPEPTIPAARISESVLKTNKEHETSSEISKKGFIYGAVTCGVVLIVFLAFNKRRRGEHVWSSGSYDSDSLYNLSDDSTASQVSPWFNHRPMGAA